MSYTYPDADDQIGQVAGEVKDMERSIGHQIPHPASHRMVEELTVSTPQHGGCLLALAKRLYAKAL
jgi:hypothetical protein